jgi:hypothetical protein
MPRPLMKPENRKKSITVSLKPSVLEYVNSAESRSAFVEDSVEGMRGLVSVLHKLKTGKWDIDRAMEELEDIAGVWESSFDETVE